MKRWAVMYQGWAVGTVARLSPSPSPMLATKAALSVEDLKT